MLAGVVVVTKTPALFLVQAALAVVVAPLLPAALRELLILAVVAVVAC